MYSWHAQVLNFMNINDNGYLNYFTDEFMMHSLYFVFMISFPELFFPVNEFYLKKRVIYVFYIKTSFYRTTSVPFRQHFITSCRC